MIAGADKGKKGKVARALPAENRVVVEGINMKTKARKATKKGEVGQLVKMAMPVHVSNVKKVA